MRRILVTGLMLLAFVAVGTVVKLAVREGVDAAVDRVTADPDIATVGDCLSGATADELAVVACTDPATHRIVAKVDGTRAAFDADDELTECASAPETESAFFEGPDTGTGYVLCLAPVTGPRT